MEKAEKIAAYFEAESPFREGIALLRERVLAAGLGEELKWGAPVYTLDGQNVLGIMRFKHHFGMWFFQGVFLSDPLGVLENAQEGKTKAMRHWKFTAVTDINRAQLDAYIAESIENTRKGLKVAPAKKSAKAKLPPELKKALEDPELKQAFSALSPYKQRDFAEYVATAKQEATKARRLQKILPMIREGIGLNDKYQKS
ncbi:Uncharacterized conserved protein YdeI, YjbR/CyaY-like superfamily, DUF1801 family [Robiginitalea myxolifaciens]|uniref:Uncharacterized conserved protein YdeI, YjbR/CyaY-like superfamily, DUF1801 family n=1 Tax=Robiginitalea myxolifaciens TaxID=400055 RepID=A0A1I6H8P6_9FLAO|nr:YdeI/OmpD-associated family protein [Robiginitalea myxolifaciens]SFR50855.1 Uncharacterized conserved protein YdeI, YjbR/CyaY-like superfamily, DUF1801 family [Robiginitalea myxolifaciens]